MSDVKDLKAKIDIVEVVSQYVKLKKVGKNYVGLCPFHKEKTPSFTVSPDMQMYHCFGCGKSGDVITFIQEIEGLSFVEAVDKLGELAGVKVDISDNVDYKKHKSILIQITDYFHSRLTPELLDYLRKRGLKDESIEKYQLGYFDDSFFEYARNNNIEKEIEELDVKSLYKRLIIPFFDANGHIISLSGRSMDGSMPKYMHLKGHSNDLLYLFNFAKQSIKEKKEAIVVEGFFDAMIMQQEGYLNTVASSGTHLTDGQVKLLKRVTDNVCMFYDGDQAGVEGTISSFLSCDDVGISLSVMSSVADKDPDEVILERLPISKVSVIEFFYNKLGTQKTIDIISHVKDPIRAYDYLSLLSKCSKIDVNDLRMSYKKRRANKKTGSQEKNNRVKDINVEESQKVILQIILQRPDLSYKLESVSIGDFLDVKYRRLYQFAIQDIKNGERPVPALWNLSAEEMQLVSEIAMRPDDFINEEVVSEIVQKVKTVILKNKIVELYDVYANTHNADVLKQIKLIQNELQLTDKVK